ncbi:MAG TPA: DUF2062 domain-containing protein [Thermoanaerobaculia bacterium]|nr:DUF2062 domain-containing protein [Thermoanaerobaculia bacterium]
MKTRHPLRDLLYQLRTEGDTPGRQAGAVGLGVFIGCSPFYGFHLLLCIVFARLFGLNRLLTYLAAHISLPGLWPLLVVAEIQAGRLLRGAGLLSLRPEDIRGLRGSDVWQFGIDLLLGSAMVGAVLAAALALTTYWIAKNRRREPEVHSLVERTARRYLEAGMFHWEFVRGKLRYDPVYFHLLRSGILPTEGPLLDLGCGRGILPALLLTARAQQDQGEYPQGWPPPPVLTLYGIESNPKVVAAARQALGDEATIEAGDLGAARLPTAQVVLLLDVLHYLPADAQESLLSRIAAALEPGGLLLIRDADAAGGWRFLATRVQERVCALARRHWRQRFHYRSAEEWRQLLRRTGLEVAGDAVTGMAEGTPYSNVLIEGRRAAEKSFEPGVKTLASAATD